MIGNTTVNAKQGRAASVINIRLLDAGTPYPGSAYEFVADLNTSDAAEADQLFNPASETVVTQFYRKSEVDSIAALKQDKVANVSDTEIGYLDGVTSGIQAQMGTKQDALETAATPVAEINWSSSGQQETVENVTARSGSVVITPTFSMSSANNISVTLEIASLSTSDVVVVSEPISNASGAACSVQFVRPNTGLGSIRIQMKNNSGSVDYTGNTTTKLFLNYCLI